MSGSSIFWSNEPSSENCFIYHLAQLDSTNESFEIIGINLAKEKLKYAIIAMLEIKFTTKVTYWLFSPLEVYRCNVVKSMHILTRSLKICALHFPFVWNIDIDSNKHKVKAFSDHFFFTSLEQKFLHNNNPKGTLYRITEFQLKHFMR